MKENSFKRNRKVLTALLLCTGFIAAQPLAVMAEDSVTSVHAVQQQKQTVTGIIKDATGEAIIGASVLEKGTSNGTITDLDGKFTLSVTPNATLVISYIGYQTQELPVVAGKVMDIQLKEDAEMLDEVVVVGYGTTKRKNFTGSVSTVKASETPLALMPTSNAGSWSEISKWWFYSADRNGRCDLYGKLPRHRSDNYRKHEYPERCYFTRSLRFASCQWCNYDHYQERKVG